MPIFFSVLVHYLTLFDSCKTVVKQMHVVDSLGTVFPKEQYFDWMNSHKQNSVCWPSVGPQDIKHKQTNNKKTNHPEYTENQGDPQISS